MSQPKLAILAGGASLRMGRDKALLPLGDDTLLTHLARCGLATGLEVLICGRGQPLGWPVDHVRFIGDAAPGEGPLRGLEAALAYADDVLLMACDLPHMTPAVLIWLSQQPVAEHGVATVLDGQLQPLFSRYTAACRPLIAMELQAGRRSPLAVLRAGHFTQAIPPPTLARHLIDADTPADWRRLMTPDS